MKIIKDSLDNFIDKIQLRNIKNNYLVIVTILVSAVLITGSIKLWVLKDSMRLRNLSIVLEKYPMDKSRYNAIFLNDKGNGIFYRIYRKNKAYTRKEKFNLNEKDIEYIYYKIMKYRFPYMKDVWGNPAKYNGDVIRLTVIMDHQAQTVSVYGKSNLSFDVMVETILETIPKRYASAYKDG